MRMGECKRVKTMAEQNRKVGMLIKLELTRRGWSQIDLAERTSLSQSAISRCTQGRGLDPERMRVIAEAFGWEPHELLRQSYDIELVTPEENDAGNVA
jgi:transcriptional regulator with XRE-family HTH domain